MLTHVEAQGEIFAAYQRIVVSMSDTAATASAEAFEAARSGDAARLAQLIDADQTLLTARGEPYGATLLHAGARYLDVVDLLLRRGMDPNVREHGDHTYAMHWSAAVGRPEIVRRLIEAGGDVIGDGDDHALAVIGWATCWDGCDDDAHREVVDLLLAKGARHHIFSAIAMNLDAEVRRIVHENPGALGQRMSRNEDHQLPLHFAVRMNRPAMVALLLELGADPLATDFSGHNALAYATAADVDRPVIETIRRLTAAELRSAERGMRSPRLSTIDLLAALAARDWSDAERMIDARLDDSGKTFTHGALPVMAKRGDVEAVRWLLDHGADPDSLWSHWGASVVALHLAILGNHIGVAKALLAAGANPTIKDSMHDGDARDWARFFERAEILALLDSSEPAR